MSGNLFSKLDHVTYLHMLSILNYTKRLMEVCSYLIATLQNFLHIISKFIFGSLGEKTRYIYENTDLEEVKNQSFIAFPLGNRNKRKKITVEYSYQLKCRSIIPQKSYTEDNKCCTLLILSTKSL